MYTTENMPVLYSINELPEGTIPLSLDLINRYHQEDPLPTENIKFTNYQTGYFCGCRSTIEFVTYKDKIVIPQKLQKHEVK